MTQSEARSWHVEDNFHVCDQKGRPVATSTADSLREARNNTFLMATAPDFLKLAEDLVRNDGNISRELRKTLEELISRARGENGKDPEDQKSPTAPETGAREGISPHPWEVADRLVEEGMALGIRSYDGTWLAYASNQLDDPQSQSNMQAMSESPRMMDTLDEIHRGLTAVPPEKVNTVRLAYLAETALDRARGEPWAMANTTP